MKPIGKLSDDELQDLVHRLFCRRRAGQLATDELLSKLVDELDRRAAEAEADEFDQDDPEPGLEAVLGWFLGLAKRQDCAERTQMPSDDLQDVSAAAV